ncbi:MAG TPA: radical SAM protein [Anaerolineaceae bacterium]|nr:radical SAM protein [Anaerolineaceae bacterium]
MDDASQVVYLNITYDCQYRCVFCVANVPSLPQRLSMKFSELMKVASLANDRTVYVISGGEPTLHNSLLPFIRVLASRGAKTILQTNGYRLADEDYCQKLIEAGISEIGIPFYHSINSRHDAITRKAGSFDHSIKGLQKLIAIKQRMDAGVVIEAKLLISKITNDQNAGIVDFIMSLPLHPDKFLLKFLVSSIETEKNKDQVEISFSEAASGIGDTIIRLASSNLPFWIAGLPLCVLPDEIRNLYVSCNRMRANNDQISVLYNDPNISGMKEEFLNVTALCPYGKDCAINMHCSGPEETYLEKHQDERIDHLGIHPIK